MKVLIITSGYPDKWSPYTGVYVERQIQVLKEKLNVDFFVLTTGDNRSGFPISIIKYIRLLFRTIIHSFIGDFEFIHAHGEFHAGIIALIPKYLRKKKLLITVHGGMINSYNQRSGIVKSLVKLTLKSADHIITVSEFLKSEIVRINPNFESKISVINMGVDTERFLPFDKDVLRIKYDLALDERIVLYIGNLIEIKGIEYLIVGFSQIVKDDYENRSCDDRSKYKLIIVGKGSDEKKLMNLSSDLGITEHVVFCGYSHPEEVPDWFAVADVVVVPSVQEGFGLVALEAMACKKPVIATNVGGLSDFIINQENGILIEPRNPEDIAQNIRLLFTDKALSSRLAESARQTALENDLVSQSYKVHQVYRDLNSLAP